MSAEPETIFDDVSYPAPLSGIPAVDKILSVLLGSVGVAGASAIAVAAIMNPNVGKKLRGLSSGTVLKVYSAANIVWQILEAWIRKTFSKELDSAKADKMDKIFDAIDQGLDLLGIVINNQGLKSLFKKDSNLY